MATIQTIVNDETAVIYNKEIRSESTVRSQHMFTQMITALTSHRLLVFPSGRRRLTSNRSHPLHIPPRLKHQPIDKYANNYKTILAAHVALAHHHMGLSAVETRRTRLPSSVDKYQIFLR
jgi:hypothetical protein